MFFVGGRCLHEYIVGLVALHPGNIFYFFYQFLLGCFVTAFAVKRTGGLVFSGDFKMTVYAGDMGGLAQGNPVFFGLRPVAIPAGSLLVFGIEKLFGFLIIGVMALFAFFVHGLGMAIVQGFIHADGLPGGNHRDPGSVAFTAL